LTKKKKKKLFCQAVPHKRRSLSSLAVMLAGKEFDKTGSFTQSAHWANIKILN
jgi:hypothetical protein